MKNIIEINDNMMRNVDFSIEFFQYSDYELVADKPTMMEENDWITFLNNVDVLQLPLLKIPSFAKTQKLWYRNNKQFDKITVDLDYSLDTNIIEFIAKKAKYKTIELKDMKQLGCIIKMNYIDNNGFQQIERIYVGRPSINTYTNDKLSLTISQLNKILTGSDFEKNCVQANNAGFYNYISLKQAFTNVYNLPHNVIDRKSYPATPFRLDESSYVPESSDDIILTDGNLVNKDIYAEDVVSNTSEYIHTQFYYDNSEPFCGYKMTTYDDNGDVIKEESESVLNWNVWGNSQDAFDKLNDYYGRDMIFNYQRLFRPFKIVIAGDEDLDMADNDVYRIRKDFHFKSGLPSDPISTETRSDFYEPRVETSYWRQEEIKGGQHFTRAGDRLVYFEVCGDVRYTGAGATILYDHHSNIYVYNMDRKIVYWNHIASLVESVPLPKQWLKMRQYITTDKLYYASRLNYKANGHEGFLSYIKPYCAVPDADDDHGERLHVASYHSFKQNQDIYGQGGNYVGDKTFACLDFGNQNLDDPTDVEIVEAKLDYITQNWKPKTVRFSRDSKRITFVRGGTFSGFDSWWDDWYPQTVKSTDYKTVNQFPKYKFMESKSIITQVAGRDYWNENEFDERLVYNYDDNSVRQIITEVCDDLEANTMLLTQFPAYDDTGITDNISRVKQVTFASTTISPEVILTKEKSAVNFYKVSNDFFWCNNNFVNKNLSNFYILDEDLTVLDINADAKAIIQSPTTLYYYDLVNQVLLYDKPVIGFEWLLAMDRERFLFTNPLINKSGELLRIGSVTNEPVRLLSFKGNRYLAGDRLACSFIKNTFYDGDGVLNIGFKPEKFELTDYEIISNSLQTYKYDTIEYFNNIIEKNGFTQIDNNDATNKEEDEQEYDEAISISMWANKDVEMDVTVTRTASDEITWYVINEFGEETGTKTISGFNFFTLELTGAFTGITVTCDFFNTELAQGEKFRGTITRRKFTQNVVPDEIIDINEDFPFLDDEVLGMSFPFLYSLNATEFYDLMNDYFLDNNEIRPFVQFTIEVPTLLLFNTSYKPFSVGSIITLSSETKYVDGYELNVEDNTISRYNENKNDYYIESMSYNIDKATTKLNLISV